MVSVVSVVSVVSACDMDTSQLHFQCHAEDIHGQHLNWEGQDRAGWAGPPTVPKVGTFKVTLVKELFLILFRSPVCVCVCVFILSTY